MSDNASPESEGGEDIRLKLNRETAKIPWQELQKFYAKGAVVRVNDGRDLIEVAMAFHEDDQTLVATWLQDGSVERATDEHARQWLESEASVWAVVVAPWVLVQDIAGRPTDAGQ